VRGRPEDRLQVKKGTKTAGVQRQYTGTAGARISISVRQRGVGGSL